MDTIAIKWYLMNDKAILPTKTDKAAGFDVYTTSDFIRIKPGERFMAPTGLGFIIEPEEYWLDAKDRGSTGSKGMHLHCGVVDVDFKGEIFICINNDNNYDIIITRSIDKVFYDEIDNILYYPACKAIAQLIPIKMPKVESCQATEEEWLDALEKSKRGDGKLGSSGK